MKLLRNGLPGAEKPGLLDAEGRVRDLSAVIDDLAGDMLTPEGLSRLAALDPASPSLVDGVPQQDLRLGPCVGRVGKFICIGLNYADHAAESGMDIPAEPVVFSKWTSAIVGPDDEVEIPRGSAKTDWEVELGVVIGKAGRYIDEADAMDHVAGYCVINDVSEREYQFERGGTWDKGKGCDTFGPLGPWLVTRDEVADPQDLAGGRWPPIPGRQHPDDDFHRAPDRLLPLAFHEPSARRRHLHRNAGVGLGQKPPVYLKPGQTMKLGIEGLGEQRQRVVAV